MFPKLLTLVILASIAYFTLKSYFAPPRRPSVRPDLEPNAGDEPEDMIACARCGAYVSEQAALVREDQGRRRYFCGQTCRDQWNSRPSG